jgi:hypothetical protein
MRLLLVCYTERAKRIRIKGGVRGKYAKRYHEGTNLVLLDPEVRKAFRDEKAVNEALRLVIRLRGTYSTTRTDDITR